MRKMIIQDSLGKLCLDIRRQCEPNTSIASEAEFVGWQTTPTGERVALYNVTMPDHRLYRSTVSEQTLLRNHLEIPSPPSPTTNSVDIELQQ